MNEISQVTRLHAGRSGTRSVPPVPRILYVDDEALVARAFSRSMRRRGFDVTIVHSGREALDLVAVESFDVLVTDLSMPGMDGITLIDKVRAQATDMPCVVATGHGEIYVRGEYALAGPEITIVDKPWNDAELAATLHGLIVASANQHARAC